MTILLIHSQIVRVRTSLPKIIVHQHSLCPSTDSDSHPPSRASTTTRLAFSTSVPLPSRLSALRAAFSACSSGTTTPSTSPQMAVSASPSFWPAVSAAGVVRS